MYFLKELNIPIRVNTLSSCLLSLLFIFSLALISCEKEEPEDKQDDFEPNNSWQEASQISLDNTYDAIISDNNDVDYYIFSASHSPASFDIVSFQFTNVGSELKVYLEILNENGQSLSTAGNDTKGANWTYNLTCPGGTYIIKVHGDDGFESTTGQYSFMISNTDSNDSYAPNHSFEAAATVNNNTGIEGEILSFDEEDFFVFTNDNPTYWQQFTANFTDISPEFQVHYEIFDSEFNSIADGVGNDQGVSASCIFPTKTQNIYIKIWGYDYYLNTKGSYTLNLSVSDPNDDYEPDDTFEDAREITSFPSGELTGTVVCDAANDNGGDYEFFRLTVKAGKKIEFTVDPEANNTELHFGIYREDQSYTGSGKDGVDGETLAYYLNNPTDEDAMLYIKLGAYPGDNGNYTISFSETIAD